MTFDHADNRTAPADEHADRPRVRRLTPAQIEAGYRRPVGSPEDRARAVRAILDSSTFSVPPAAVRRPAWAH